MYVGGIAGTLDARHRYVGRSPVMFVPKCPVSDGGNKIAIIASASASQKSSIIHLVIGAPSSLLIDKQKQPFLIDVHRGPVVNLSSRVVPTKILRQQWQHLDYICRGLKCDGPRTTGA